MQNNNGGTTNATEYNQYNTMDIAVSNQELVTNKRKKSRKLLIMFTVIVVLVLSCILLIALYQHIYTLPVPQSYKRHHSQITLDGVLDGSYEPRRFNGTWVSDNELMTKNTNGQVILFNVEANERKILLFNQTGVEPIYDVALSPDKKYLLIAHAFQRVYRHSMFAHYTIVNIETQRRIPIRKQGNEPLQFAKWSTVGNGYAYVYRNDIYYRKTAETNEDIRITKTGLQGIIYNGICDWVYEEEVFSSSAVLWFSPDGKRLAFATFNDSNTNTMFLHYYGEPGSIYFQYPHLINLRYPKAGVLNPSVLLNVVDVEEQTPIVTALSLPSYKEPILTAVTWVDENKLYATWMNRVQNKAQAFIYNADDQMHNTLIKTFEKTGGWLDLFKPPIFSADGQKMLYIYAHQQNDSDHFDHVTLFDITNQRAIALTAGLFTVTEIISWDEANRVIYFKATVVGHPEYQHVFKVSDETTNAPHKLECIDCNGKSDDEECSFSTVAFSRNSSYYCLTCAGPNVPKTTVYDKENNKIMIWEDNRMLKNILKNVDMPQVKYLDVPLENSKWKARVKLYLPPNFDANGQKKYPLLINVYSGPGSNFVQDKFNLDWNSYLCANKNVIIGRIDGRGAGLKSEEMRFSIYRKLGSYEIDDQIFVTKYLQDNYPYIDKKRTAIWGWSYGGYAAGMALANDKHNLFKCGISVAPVTDWIYYDSIYVERFMGLPLLSDNLAGYVSSSLIRKALNLTDKMYLLIHGTMDDNVHYQQSMLLARELELHDIPFQQQSYPDEDHSLGGVRHHFYHLLESFLSECLAFK